MEQILRPTCTKPINILKLQLFFAIILKNIEDINQSSFFQNNWYLPDNLSVLLKRIATNIARVLLVIPSAISPWQFRVMIKMAR